MSPAKGSFHRWSTGLVLLLCGAAILIGGALQYRSRATQAREKAIRELQLIADSKLNQVIDWRNERLNDARFLSEAAFVAHDVQQLLAQPDSPGAKAAIRSWLTSLKRNERYSDIVVFGPDLRARFALASAVEDASGDGPLAEQLAAVLRSPEVTMTDLHRDHPAAPVHLEILSPIFAVPSATHDGGKAGANARIPIAVIVLRVDPTVFLFPQLTAWALPSTTGETMLVRREGAEIVFLNNLRFLRDTPLNLRLPLENSALSAAKALNGDTGIVEGIDYRGHAVVATFRQVPNSSWMMGTKMDRAEMFSNRDKEVLNTLLIGLSLSIGLIGSVGWFWRSRENQFLQRQLTADRALRESEERFRLIASTIEDVFWMVDVGATRNLYVSPAYEKIWGRTVQSLAADPRSFLAGIHRDDRPAMEAVLARQRDGQPFDCNYRVVRPDGSIRWVRDCGYPVRGPDGQVIHYTGVAKDITARKKSEQEVSDALNYIRTVVAAAPIGIVTFAANGQAVAANETAARLVGGTVEAIRVQNFRDIESWRASGILAAAEAALATGVDQDVEAAFISSFEKSVWVRVRLVRFKHDGQDNLLVLLTDISASKESEGALRQAEEKYRSIFSRATEGIFQTTPDGRFLSANPAMARILGYGSPEELIRERIDIAREGYVDPGRREEFKRLLAGGDTVENFQYELLRKDGSRMWVSENARAVRESSRKLLYYEGTLQDITQKIVAENAIRESEQRFRQLAENISEVFWIRDTTTDEIEYISPAFDQIWGRSRDGLCPTPQAWLDTIHPDDRPRVREALPQQAAGSYCESYRIERPDGTVRWIRDRAFPVRNLAGEAYRIVGIAEDVTERRTLEAQLREAQKMEALGTLAGGIAHDFNNILAAINGYTALAQTATEHREDAAAYLDEVMRASARAAALVRQILAFSRRHEDSRSPVRVDHVVMESVQLLRATMPSTIEFVFTELAEPLTVSADPTQVQQVIMNLGTNALHAMSNQRGVLSMKIEKVEFNAESPANGTHLPAGVYARLSVGDTGHGIEPRILNRIFEPFFTTKPPGEGTGLGLSVVHGIMQAHQGAVIVSSTPGAGTTFDLYFPVIPSAPSVKAPALAPASKGRGEHLLVVDDEEPIAQVTAQILRTLGYVVETHPSARAALAAMHAQPGAFALIITDQTMPGMTGLEFAAVASQIQPGVPIILTTGYGPILTPENIAAAGVAELLPKPASVAALSSLVHRLLNSN